jgi:predicted nucleic acid-binding protein
VRHLRADRLAVAAARDAYALSTDAIVHEQEVLARQVLELAMASGYSAYDCELVALAQLLEVPLVTFDRARLREFPDLALEPASFLGL